MLGGLPLLFLILFKILIVIILCGRYKINPFLALIGVSISLGLMSGLGPIETIEAIRSGFGGMMKYIGIIVVMGSIIGIFLERSGGAAAIADGIINWFGKNKTLPAMSIIGAVISVPVFCDSGFILLSGLTERLSKTSTATKAQLSLALGTGLYTTHTLIPPTPGPIAAAGNLGAGDYLGTIILIGLIITIPLLVVTLWFIKKFTNNIQAEIIQKVAYSNSTVSMFKALIPILIPIILISIGTISRLSGLDNVLVGFIGDPLIAIGVGMVLAIVLLGHNLPEGSQNAVKDAIKIAGPILIITGAGGAFGGVLKATNMSSTVASWMSGGSFSDSWGLITVFLIAALLKSAQGSSTSSMVITSSILAPLIPVLGWEDPTQMALAVSTIGAGAMSISHYNDSYFWVFNEFSGISHQDSIKSFSLLTGLMGAAALVTCLIIQQFL